MKFWQSLQFARTEDLVGLATAIESQTPFDGVFLGDHTLHPEQCLTPYPYTPDGKMLWAADMHWPDIGASFAAMATATRRLRFVTSVMILPVRHPDRSWPVDGHRLPCCRAIVSRWVQGLDGWRTNTARQQSTFTRGASVATR